MATGLNITFTDIKKHTALNGNVDEDKIAAFLKIAIDIHLQNYLGTDLNDKIHADIVAATLAGDYITLNNTYIKPMIIHWAMVEYLPWAAFSIQNKGVYRHGSETSESVAKNEIDYLVEKERDIAEHYTQRLIDYLCNNNSLFPEYSTNSNGDVSPDKDTTFSGWVL